MRCEECGLEFSPDEIIEDIGICKDCQRDNLIEAEKDSPNKDTSRNNNAQSREAVIRRLFWPTIDNTVTAKSIASSGVLAAYFLALGSIIVLLIDLKLNADSHQAFYVAGFLVIAFLIKKMSRTASIIAFSFVLYELLFKIVAILQITALPTSAYGMVTSTNSIAFFLGRILGTMIFLLFALAFLNSLRATFKYHQLMNKSENIVKDL